MPAFAHWEGTIAPHTQSAELVSTMDILPSLVTLAGGASRLVGRCGNVFCCAILC